MLSTQENLAKSLEDKKLQMKNQDKVTANYAKWSTKKKAKLPSNQPKESQDLEPRLVTKCKFCEKKHIPNECWYL